MIFWTETRGAKLDSYAVYDVIYECKTPECHNTAQLNDHTGPFPAQLVCSVCHKPMDIKNAIQKQ